MLLLRALCRLRINKKSKYRHLIPSNDRSLASSSGSPSLEDIERCNHDCRGFVEIQHVVDGNHWGVVARRDFEEGSRVIRAQIDREPLMQQDMHTIQIDFGRHIHMKLPALFLNHSCYPNVRASLRDNDACYDFVALRDIPAGQQIQFDYETTEYDMHQPFNCLCGASNCRKLLQGFLHHYEQVLAQYGEDAEWMVAPYLMEWYRQQQREDT